MKSKYRKFINVKYNYVDSLEGETALAEVFDDIFKRISKKHEKKVSLNRTNALTNIYNDL